MAQLRVSIAVQGPVALTQTQVNQLKAATLRQIAASWDVRYRALKFTAAGARKYGYARRITKNIRTGKINRDAKGRPRAPDARPLVWSRQSLALSKTHTIYATRKNSRVTYPIRTFNRPTSNKRIKMRAEFTKVLPSEERKLGKDGEKFLRAQFRRNRRHFSVVRTNSLGQILSV